MANERERKLKQRFLIVDSADRNQRLGFRWAYSARQAVFLFLRASGYFLDDGYTRFRAIRRDPALDTARVMPPSVRLLASEARAASPNEVALALVTGEGCGCIPFGGPVPRKGKRRSRVSPSQLSFSITAATFG